MRLQLSLLLLFSLTVSQMWLCCEHNAEAARLYPLNNWVQEMKEDMKQKEIHKLFKGRPTNSSEKEFDESKRRIPSCPDPLHNR
ncbi:hypothetical protein AAC387_Pa05g2976 [Persea americana]